MLPPLLILLAFYLPLRALAARLATEAARLATEAARLATDAARHLPAFATEASLPIHLQALCCASRRTQKAAASALTRGLPTLSLDELAVLPERISLVSQALQACRGFAEGTIAAVRIIEAIERLGDRRLSLAVEGMTCGHPVPEISAAAGRCVQTLEALAKRRAELGHLLRPAEPA